MFSFVERLATMHEGTRQVICRLAFLFGCFLPTLMVLSWCASHYLPGRAEAARQQLADRLGLEVELAEVTYPRPGVIAYLGVRLADPELGETLMTFGKLEVTRTGDHVSLVATQSEVARAGFEKLWELLQRQLRLRDMETLRLRAAQVDYRQGDTVHRLTDLQTRLDATDSGAQAVVAWRVAGLDMKQPFRLGMVRDRSTSPPSTQWQLETGETPLPCSLVTALLPEAARLGEASRFRGSVWAQQSHEGWNGAMTGQVYEVDLKSALGPVFPHPLQGKALLTVDRATFRQGRLESLHASVFASHGTYGRSLVEAAAQHLGMQVVTARPLLADAEPFRELGLGIVLDASGLTLRGICSSVSGGVLVSRWGPVLVQPVPERQSLAGLFKMLSPAEPAMVALSREAEPLARMLPLPTADVRQAQRTQP